MIKYFYQLYELPNILDQWSGKGGSSMNITVLIDWKFILAAGAAGAIVIFATKMDGQSAERVSVAVADAFTRQAVVFTSDC